LVAEWTTTSAPSSSGRCSAGEQKQLSTAKQCAGRAWAMSAMPAMSMTSVSGFDGVSMKKSLVRG
jgi:hypothetical protein